MQDVELFGGRAGIVGGGGCGRTIFRAMSDARPVSSTDLAARTGLAERYVREWLHNQAASGWVTFDPARHVREQLAPGGTVLLVEPATADHPEENHHPLGRLFYSASTIICTPASLAPDVGGASATRSGSRGCVRSWTGRASPTCGSRRRRP